MKKNIATIITVVFLTFFSTSVLSAELIEKTYIFSSFNKETGVSTEEKPSYYFNGQYLRDKNMEISSFRYTTFPAYPEYAKVTVNLGKRIFQDFGYRPASYETRENDEVYIRSPYNKDLISLKKGGELFFPGIKIVLIELHDDGKAVFEIALL